MGGMVLETNMTEILTRIEDQNKLEKQEVMLWCIFATLFCSFLYAEVTQRVCFSSFY